jgi:hypothetical protein
MKNFLTFVLLNFTSFLFAQNSVRIHLNSKVEDDKLKKTQAIIPVYQYTGLGIEPYDNFGAETKKNTAWITIKKLPDMATCVDTAFTFIYFSGADNDNNSGYLLTLIGNYKRMPKYTAHFFVDKNNNLDFTDDGMPYLIPYHRDSVIINLENKQFPGSDYELKLSRVVFEKNAGYKNLLSDHYMKHSGKKVFTKINNCYREQRFNLCSANFKSETDSFTIGIKDMNVNAVYNDDGTDMIYIGPYKNAIISEDLITFKKGKHKTAFEWNEKKFIITAIDPIGKWIDIEQVTNKKANKKLRKWRKVPKIHFVNEMSVKYTLKQFRKKHIYLYFFNDDLNGLKEDTFYLRKIHNEFGHKIVVIGMNYGDEPKSMRFFQQYFNIPWLIGMSNREINKKFYVENLPKAYWIGKHRRLRERNFTPKMMYDKASKKFGKK